MGAELLSDQASVLKSYIQCKRFIRTHHFQQASLESRNSLLNMPGYISIHWVPQPSQLHARDFKFICSVIILGKAHAGSQLQVTCKRPSKLDS